MTKHASTGLSSPAATALYVGALLGPSLLLLPGIAVAIAGPASIVAWTGLLVLSGLLAMVFLGLGRAMPGTDGVAGYVRAGLGPTAARVVRWWFVAGVVLGAPVVCLIGAAYLGQLFGVGRPATMALAAGLLLAVVLVNLAGRTTGSAVQLVLVGVLLGVVVLAVVGSLPHGSPAHWTPFLPHGAGSIGRAAAPLMLCFVGWEAISPLIHRLRDPGDQLPRVFGAAFAITAVVYLAVAVSTVAVLGGAAGEAPLAGLLTAAIGPSGAVLGAVVAVVLTLAATNAYLSGAAALVAVERGGRIGSSRWVLPVVILLVGVVLLTAVGAGVLSIAALVNLPTAMFIAVYLACAATGVRLLTGGVRIAAGIAGVLVAAVLVFVGPALLATAAVAAAALAAGVTHRTRARRRSGDSFCAAG